jgi:hypothetical protein
MLARAYPFDATANFVELIAEAIAASEREVIGNRPVRMT